MFFSYLYMQEHSKANTSGPKKQNFANTEGLDLQKYIERYVNSCLAGRPQRGEKSDRNSQNIYFLFKNTQKLRILSFPKELRCNRLLKLKKISRKNKKNTQFVQFSRLPKVVGLVLKPVNFHQKRSISRKFKHSRNYFGVQKYEQFTEETHRTGRPYEYNYGPEFKSFLTCFPC